MNNIVDNKEPTKEYCLELFKKLTEPIECGKIINGVRHQKSGGEWSRERIFILSDELLKDKPHVHYRSYFDAKKSWIEAITLYVRSVRGFLHPRLKLYCIEYDMVTVRNLDFDLDIL
jgi:hypothetical protein